jgi:hypothetical protein
MKEVDIDLCCFIEILSRRYCRHASCKLSEIVHNVWLQSLGKKGSCLYVAMANDYVQAFKQMMLYYLFKKGGHFGQGRPNKSELLLKDRPWLVILFTCKCNSKICPWGNLDS